MIRQLSRGQTNEGSSWAAVDELIAAELPDAYMNGYIQQQQYHKTRA